MSDERRRSTFEEKIDHLEGLLVLESNIYQTHLTPEETLVGEDIFGDLFWFVCNIEVGEDDDDIDTRWVNFHNMLKLFEGKDVKLRKICLFTPTNDGGWGEDEFFDDGQYDCSLLHETCNHNPPAEVVETLLGIIPVVQQKNQSGLITFGPPDQYNHLAQDACGEYPIHNVMRNGGSIELVKLLVNADNRRETLKMISKRAMASRTSVYHALIAFRDKHKPEVFSEILRYLCCVAGWSILEKMYESTYNVIPAVLLSDSLAREGLTVPEVLEHNDFIFLVKATCYHNMCKIKGAGNDVEYHKRLQETERISLSEALTICSPYFPDEFAVEALNCVLLVDSQFLMEKDTSGQYPVHRMISSPSYFMHRRATYHRSGEHLCLVMSVIMKHAPQCAQQFNDEGLLPLHLAADLVRVNLHDSIRVDLVNMIWNAYPEAVGIIDKSTSLPPFALAARDKDVVIGSSSTLSSSFFLLRQHPEIISDYIVSGEKISAQDSLVPLAKRPRKDTE